MTVPRQFLCGRGHLFHGPVRDRETMERKVFLMRSQRAKRLVAASAAGLLMTGGVAVGTAGTASASSSGHEYNHSRYCDDDRHDWWDDDCDDHKSRGGNGDHHDYDNDRGHHDDRDDHDDNGRGGNGDHDDNGRGGNGDHDKDHD
jgi:hypothetical protein